MQKQKKNEKWKQKEELNKESVTLYGKPIKNEFFFKVRGSRVQGTQPTK